MNAEKLRRLQQQVRIGGKGTPRRKKKVMHQSAATDDKKLQSSLKKLSVSTIPGIEEVNIIKDDLTVIHFNNPKAQASLSANTFAVTGHGESKKIVEMLPEILPQLGQDTVMQLRMFANTISGSQGKSQIAPTADDDEVPLLVNDFEEVAKMDEPKMKAAPSQTDSKEPIKTKADNAKPKQNNVNNEKNDKKSKKQQNKQSQPKPEESKIIKDKQQKVSADKDGKQASEVASSKPDAAQKQGSEAKPVQPLQTTPAQQVQVEVPNAKTNKDKQQLDAKKETKNEPNKQKADVKKESKTEVENYKMDVKAPAETVKSNEPINEQKTAKIDYAAIARQNTGVEQKQQQQPKDAKNKPEIDVPKQSAETCIAQDMDKKPKEEPQVAKKSQKAASTQPKQQQPQQQQQTKAKGASPQPNNAKLQAEANISAPKMHTPGSAAVVPQQDQILKTPLPEEPTGNKEHSGQNTASANKEMAPTQQAVAPSPQKSETTIGNDQMKHPIAIKKEEIKAPNQKDLETIVPPQQNIAAAVIVSANEQTNAASLPKDISNAHNSNMQTIEPLKEMKPAQPPSLKDAKSTDPIKAIPAAEVAEALHHPAAAITTGPREEKIKMEIETRKDGELKALVQANAMLIKDATAQVEAAIAEATKDVAKQVASKMEENLAEGLAKKVSPEKTTESPAAKKNAPKAKSPGKEMATEKQNATGIQQKPNQAAPKAAAAVAQTKPGSKTTPPKSAQQVKPAATAKPADKASKPQQSQPKPNTAPMKKTSPTPSPAASPAATPTEGNKAVTAAKPKEASTDSQKKPSPPAQKPAQPKQNAPRTNNGAAKTQTAAAKKPQDESKQSKSGTPPSKTTENSGPKPKQATQSKSEAQIKTATNAAATVSPNQQQQQAAQAAPKPNP